MKYLFTILIFCIASSLRTQAQTGATIRGVIIDSIDRKPVPSATLSLYREGRLLMGTLTDSTGLFTFYNLSYGSYQVKFSAVGYHPYSLPVQIVKEGITAWDLGIIRVQQDITLLNAVTVRGQRPLIENRPDGLVFNVENLPGIAGQDAAEVLRRVPLLSIDPNGGLSLRGSSNIRVFIDGKPSDIYASSVADALKSVRGENIARIEVITHPSARYDAEGTDGVVNIITRKNIDTAINGNLTVAPSNRSQNFMGDVHGKSGKWIINLDAYYQKYNNQNGSVLERESGSTRFLQKNEWKNTGDYFFGGGSLLYSLDSLNTFNFGYRARHSPNRTSTVSDNYIGGNPGPGPSFRRLIDAPNGNEGSSFNAGYTGSSRNKQKEYSFLGSVFLSAGTNRYDMEQLYEDRAAYRENFDSRTSNRDLALQADYSRRFDSRLTWETGAKYMRKTLSSDSRFGIYDFRGEAFVPDTARSNHFSYSYTITSFYQSVSFRQGKWSVIGGLRYENTGLHAAFKGASLRVPSYDNWVPNLLVSHNLTNITALKLSYRLQIGRPYIIWLNPTVNNSDSLTVQQGNPLLRPELSNRFQLSYTGNFPKLFTDLALFYNHNRNTIENIRTPLPGGIFHSTWQNIGQNRRGGLSASLRWKPSTRLDLGTTITLQYVHLASLSLMLDATGIMSQVTLNGTYKFPKGYSVYIYSYLDLTGSLQLQGRREGWKYYSMTLSKSSLNNRLNLSLRLDAFLFPYTYIEETTVTESFRQTQITRYQNQNIRLTVSWKFGKKEIKAPRIRQAETEN